MFTNSGAGLELLTLILGLGIYYGFSAILYLWINYWCVINSTSAQTTYIARSPYFWYLWQFTYWVIAAFTWSPFTAFWILVLITFINWIGFSCTGTCFGWCGQGRPLDFQYEIDQCKRCLTASKDKNCGGWSSEPSCTVFNNDGTPNRKGQSEFVLYQFATGLLAFAVGYTLLYGLALPDGVYVLNDYSTSFVYWIIAVFIIILVNVLVEYGGYVGSDKIRAFISHNLVQCHIWFSVWLFIGIMYGANFSAGVVWIIIWAIFNWVISWCCVNLRRDLWQYFEIWVIALIGFCIGIYIFRPWTYDHRFPSMSAKME